MNDNIVKVTDREGKVTEYTHDALKRVTELVAGSRKDPSWDEWYGGCTTGVAGRAVSRGASRYPNWNGLGGNTSDGTATDGNAVDGAAGGVVTDGNAAENTVDGATAFGDGSAAGSATVSGNGGGSAVDNAASGTATGGNGNGQGGAADKYDGDGNLVQEQDCTNHADPVKYEYTAENRLAVVSQGGTVLMAAMYDGDNNRVFQIDNTYKWEDCYSDDVLIPKSERTENGNSLQEELALLVKGGANAKGYTLTEYVNDVNRENTEVLAEYKADGTMRQAYTYGESGNGERIGVDKVDKSTETSYFREATSQSHACMALVTAARDEIVIDYFVVCMMVVAV